MTDLNPTQKFIIFCLEEYKNKNRMKGKEALTIFEKHHVFSFLETSYDVLHTQGMKYILDEINEFIKNKNL